MSSPVRILVVGRSGQVAQALAAATWPGSLTPVFLGRPALDIENPEAVTTTITRGGYAGVVNTAAYTNVDQAESNPEAAWAVNRDGPLALASACADTGIPLIHLSTDYVFDGKKTGAYVEDDTVNPISTYGSSKAAGEEAVRSCLPQHVILRTSWVFSTVGNNFLRKMLQLAAQRNELRIVNNQYGCPTAAGDIAETLIHIVDALLYNDSSECYGTYHYCGAPRTCWYDFAREIFAQAEKHGLRTSPELKAVPYNQITTIAPRPMNTALDCSRIRTSFNVIQRDWRNALPGYLERLMQE
jgi:dTDP-4-dehydrorhamnose reductase